MIWSIKYAPKNINEFVDSFEFQSLISYVKNYNQQKKKAVIVYGKTGTGKTNSVYALANELNLEVFELNASDFRNKKDILELVGNSLGQQSLFNKGKIVLIDEIDGLSGTKDRGAVPALVSLIKNSSYPVVITCEDPFDSKFSSLRSKCLLLEFKELDYLKQAKYLDEICKKENLEIDNEILKSISRRSGGDLRAAINDLQSLVIGKNNLNIDDLDAISFREKEQEISNVLRLIFKTKNSEAINLALDNLDVNLDELFMWVDHNLPFEYSNVNDAYNSLSKASIFKGRIIRWQHWRFLVYFRYFLSLGVAISKEDKNPKEVNYKRSDRILKTWIAKSRNSKKNSIISKISKELHMSESKLRKDFVYLKKFSKNIDYDLDEEEIEYLKV